MSDEWQPIETAPKDSKAKLVWCPENRCIYCVSWLSTDGMKEGWTIFGGGYLDHLQHATHWMPPPAAPN